MKKHLCQTFSTYVILFRCSPAALKRKTGVELLDDVSGMTWTDSSGQVCIWLARDADESVLVHEAVHAAHAVCKRCGVKRDEEVLAYLTQEIWSALC